MICENLLKVFSASPVLFEIETFNHVMLIGTTPYYLIKAAHMNSFFVSFSF